MTKFKVQLMKTVYTTETIDTDSAETALRVVEDMIEQDDIDESHCEEDGWQIDYIQEI